jgi:PPOX class probable F420-dependent enzyme
MKIGVVHRLARETGESKWEQAVTCSHLLSPPIIQPYASVDEQVNPTSLSLLEAEKEEEMIELSAELQQLLQKPIFCFFATIMPDGSPQMTQTWIDTDGQYILINTVEGYQKLRNVQRDPRVMISIVDPAHLERAVSIRGRVVEITKEGADVQFKQLIQRNMGEEKYRYGQPGQVRILLKIEPEKIR